MRTLPNNYISWSKIHAVITNNSATQVPAEVLERGKKIHEMIQNSINVFSEFTPIVPYKIRERKVWLLGHIDAVDFNAREFIEIKSRRYYENNKDIVLMQCAYYDYVLNQFLRKMGMQMTKSEKYKCKILLYEYNSITNSIQLSEVHPTQTLLERKWQELKGIIKKL